MFLLTNSYTLSTVTYILQITLRCRYISLCEIRYTEQARFDIFASQIRYIFACAKMSIPTPYTLKTALQKAGSHKEVWFLLVGTGVLDGPRHILLCREQIINPDRFWMSVGVLLRQVVCSIFCLWKQFLKFQKTFSFCSVQKIVLERKDESFPKNDFSL